jgi:aspartate-semialdehyde dehydrogenase
LEAARKMDVVFVSVSGDFSLEFCEKMADGPDGCVVIDNSSAFRMKEGFALCVPEINADASRKSNKKVISNPNCTTAIGIMALWPLHQKYGLKKVLMSTYQAASGAGQEGMDELFDGAKKVTSGEKKVADNKIFAHPLPFNLIPHIDVFQDNLYTKEEMKVTWECRKIMDLPNLPVSCTAVRIPTMRSHAETIVIETEKPIDPTEARDFLKKAPGVLVNDEPQNKKYPMPLTTSTNYNVEVGRIRQNLVFGDRGLEFFVCGDQLLRGAALNAVLIAESLMEPVGKPFTPTM